jgi:hypothetical protein
MAPWVLIKMKGDKNAQIEVISESFPILSGRSILVKMGRIRKPIPFSNIEEKK